MKRSRVTIRSLAGFALALSGLLTWAAWSTRTSSATAPPARSAAPVSTGAEAGEAEKKNLLAKFAETPLQFVENRGQVDSRVAFYVQGRDRTLYFSPQGITFALTGEVTSRSSRETSNAEAFFNPAGSRDSVAADTRQHWALKLDFVNANPRVRLKGQEPTKTVTSYFLGPRDRWRTGLASYATLVYENLWPGIDLVYSGSANRLKYQFVVKPGAKPDRIKLAYRGASSVSLNGQGQLAVTTLVGEFHDDTPYSYQEINGQRVEVKTSYALEAKARAGKQAYGFRVDNYDNSQPLVIDPAIVIYAGYIGGAGDERGLGIAVDSAGNAYVTGETSSSQATFPVAAGADMTFDGVRDAFIVKVNATGAGIVYATYIGGAGDDMGLDIAVDGAGNAYVTGSTSSTQTSFPITVGPDLNHNGGSYDAFVAKLNAAGTALVYSGFIGGSGEDGGTAIAVDAGGNAYITGGTSSSEATFPISIGPDLTYNGGLLFGDAFIAKVNTAGTALAYCGYIGGSGEEGGLGIAVDSNGNAYIAGVTTSDEATFPDAAGPDLTYNGGVRDAFVAKVNPAGTSLVYAGYIGGASGDAALGIAIDAAGNAYVTGDTASAETSFPVAVGPDLTYNEGGDAFIARINPAGTVFVFCGYIGGAGRDGGTDVRVDGSGSAYVTGATASGEATFPVTVGPALNFNGGGFNGDAFVAKVTATGLTLDYCGYLGGNGDDIANALAIDSDGNAYIAGETTSTQTTFPGTVGPDLTYNGGVRDAFVARVGVGCTFSVNPTGESFAASGGTGSASVTAGIGCGRTAISNASWITITSGAGGTGNGTVNYSVALNTGSTARSGTIAIGGQTFTVNQAAPAWEAVVLTTGQAEIKTWTLQGRTYAYVKLSFPNAGYRVLNWGQPVRAGNDFSADAAVEKFTGASVQAVTTTAQIYDLGVVTDGNYTFTFKNSGTVVKTQAFNLSSAVPPPNPIDNAREFVKQQYRDFLNREADQAGEDFWTDNITKCSDSARRPAGQTEAQCTVRQRETTSGAFFLSPEFQDTGYYVYRMYQGALGRQPKLSEFTPDAQFVGAGIIVNGQLSAAKINQNKTDFTQQFVNCTDAAKYRCAEFKAIYDGLTNQQYVDKLFETTGVNASASDRQALVDELNANPTTGRASVLQKVVDGINVISEGNQQFTTSYGEAFYNSEFNEAFVQLEYFGYMKRDPDADGYAFWLGKLNQFGGNFVNAEMVLAFITSPEYRARFGQP